MISSQASKCISRNRSLDDIHGIEPHLGHYRILSATLGARALAAAPGPAENVRLVIEGEKEGCSWLYAWKEVFQEIRSSSVSRQQDIGDTRQPRGWIKEVGVMDGRDGAGPGKDVCSK
jgi:hypothetical protein